MKKTIILSLIIFSIIALSGCTSSTDKLITQCETDYETTLGIGTCIANIAIERDTESQALEICDRIDSGVKNTCRRNTAVKFENKALCFDNENKIETYICLSNLAAKQKDSEVCKEIERQKDEEFCYRKVAVALLDNTVCELITDNNQFRDNCIASVKYEKDILVDEVEPTTIEDLSLETVDENANQ